jgi:malate dehydrogenase (oxaloacetate-decarboxylating)
LQHRGLVRTFRIRTRRKFGNLGLLTSALGDAGASIGEILTRKIGHSFTVRDFNLVLDGDEHLLAVREAVSALSDSEIVEVLDPVEQIHLGGKIRTRSRVPLTDVSKMQTALAPGVSEIVARIDGDVSLADRYTARRRTVAVISDGTGLSGVGRVKPIATLPILEAKSSLLASLGGLNGLPLVVEADSEDALADHIAAVSASCGAILLDAVAGARATRVRKRLSETLDIPIFNDDADAPAVAALAGVINACRYAGVSLETAQIGQLGLGTAGSAIASLVMRHTGRPVVGDDVHPGSLGRHVALGGRAGSLEEIMAGCDVVVANTGHSGVIPPSLVRERQVVLALSVPRPEIDPYDATLAGAAFAADGNMVEKAVVLPGVLLGALAVGAREIDDDMKIAAAMTLAELAPEGDLLPTPLEEHVHAHVAAAVARAAVEHGHARHELSEELLRPEAFEEAIQGARELPF